MNGSVKKIVDAGLLFSLFLFMIFLMSCGMSGSPEAKNAQEFVQKYSQAYNNGNVDVIVKMTSLGKGQTEEILKEDLKKDIKAKGFGYTAWSNTSYVSEEDRGKYVRVKVAVNGARSEIVLLKEEGILKLAPNPSDYE